MSAIAIITMIICVGGVGGGFVFFLYKAIALERNKEETEE